jgi:hypothetical protein
VNPSGLLKMTCVVAVLVCGCAHESPPQKKTANLPRPIVDAPLPSGERWSVAQQGDVFVIANPGHFSFSIPTAQAQADGWSVVESSPARVRFVSTTQETLTVYADGRAYWNGEFKAIDPAMSDAGAIAASHASPAEVTVPPLLGRIDHNTAGDEDNDGYNEAVGAYEIIASGPRVEVTLSPRTALLARPVLEIASLPAGNVLVTLEGQLVPSAIRLANGNVLIELPARLQRQTVVNVRVE